MDRSPFQLGRLRIDPARNVVGSGETAVTLEPKVMDLLCALAAAPADSVVARESLIDRVWQVEYGADESLTRAISMIRRAIKSAGEDEAYIETIPKRGYRLLKPVVELQSSPDPKQSITQTASSSAEPQSTARTEVTDYAPGLFRSRAMLAIVPVIALFILIGLFATNGRREVSVDRPEDVSLAVLPVQLDSDDGQRDLLNASLHDEMISAFLAVPDLRVVPRTSVLRYVESTQSPDEIARELGVDLLVEARVALNNNEFEIDARLIEPFPSAQYSWTEIYRGARRDLPQAQSSIAVEIGQQLGFTVDFDERIEPMSTQADNTEAYNLYLLGKAQLATFSPEGFLRGIADMKRASELSPQNIRYVEALALAHSDLGHVPLPPEMSFVVARDYAQQARAMARMVGVDFVVGAELTLAEVALYYDWQIPRAKQLFETVLDRHPHSARANVHYAWLLDAIDDFEGAERYLRIARDMSPYDPLYAAWLGWWLTDKGRYDEAIEQADASLAMMPDFPIGVYVKGAALAGKGDFDSAIELHQSLADRFPYAYSWPLGVTYALAGQDTKAREIAARCSDENDLHGWCRMTIYCALEDTELALQGVESAIQHRHSFIPWIYRGYGCPQLGGDPRFESLRSVVRYP